MTDGGSQSTPSIESFRARFVSVLIVGCGGCRGDVLTERLARCIEVSEARSFEPERVEVDQGVLKCCGLVDEIE